jgi:hypothetical protein
LIMAAVWGPCLKPTEVYHILTLCVRTVVSTPSPGNANPVQKELFVQEHFRFWHKKP